MVLAQDWALSSIWDMVVTPLLFISHPMNGPVATRSWLTLEDAFYALPTCSVHGTQTVGINPCYFLPQFLLLECTAVAVLPMIEEDRLFKLFTTHSDVECDFCDVGVQTTSNNLETVW